MTTKLNSFLFLICLLLSTQINLAQQTSTARLIDSTQVHLYNQQSQQLKDLDKARVEDSLKRVALQEKFDALSTVDNIKKEELLEELNRLKNSETERLALKRKTIDSLKTVVKGYPVVPFFNDTLFSIYNKFGSLTAKERALGINTRIQALAERFLFKPDSIQVISNETSTDLVYQEVNIMSISENDALWQNSSREKLAIEYKKIIGTAILTYKEETSLVTIAKQIGMAIVVLFILFVFIYFIGKLFAFTSKKIESFKDLYITGFTIGNYELLTAERQLHFILGINKIIKWIFIFLIVYIALPVLFSIFPWTKGFAETLFSYLIDPLKEILHSIINYLPNLFTIIVIFLTFSYLIKAIRFFKTEIERGALTIDGFYPDWAMPTFQIIKVLLYAFMFVTIFPLLPSSDSPVFKGVSVFLGVLFTFGSSGPLSNLIAGLVLTYMRAFKIGDRIKIGDVTGDIIEKSMLVTRIRTTKNEIISIPNSNVMSSHTINFSSDAVDKGLILHTTVTIGYDVPWKEIQHALIEAALRTEHLLKEPQPFVLQTSLEDFYVAYQINAYTKEPNKQAIIYSQLHQNIQDCCNEAGIEILSPHYRAARDGNMTTIPSDYLAKDYQAPPFNIQVTKKEN
jgi:small-conductance mechanosensitive channel